MSGEVLWLLAGVILALGITGCVVIKKRRKVNLAPVAYDRVVKTARKKRLKECDGHGEVIPHKRTLTKYHCGSPAVVVRIWVREVATLPYADYNRRREEDHIVCPICLSSGVDSYRGDV